MPRWIETVDDDRIEILQTKLRRQQRDFVRRQERVVCGIVALLAVAMIALLVAGR